MPLRALVGQEEVELRFIEARTCTQCGTSNMETGFYLDRRSRRMPDRSRCKACIRKQQRDYYAANKKRKQREEVIDG